MDHVCANDPSLSYVLQEIAILDTFALGFWPSVPISDVLFLNNVILIKRRKYLPEQVKARRSRAVILE